jgi:MSHA pilin protein MshD
MNLSQSMFALAAFVILGLITLSATKGILSQNETVNDADTGIAAISLAQSLIQEAMSKYFDANPETATPASLDNPAHLTDVNHLGHGPTEKYHDGANDFNDFDDFNGLFLVYKSSNPADTARTPGSDWETVVPGLKAKFYVKATVEYVKVDAADIPIPDQVSNQRTWHKKLTVRVINTTTKDTLVFRAIQSYWN